MARTVYIVEQDCQGCGMCADICPEVFRLNDRTEVAEVTKPAAGRADLLQTAGDSCPADWSDWVATCGFPSHGGF